jgi:PAS domain S-box-containing protein
MPTADPTDDAARTRSAWTLAALVGTAAAGAAALLEWRLGALQALVAVAAAAGPLVLLLAVQGRRARRLSEAAAAARAEALAARAELVAGLDAVEAGFALAGPDDRILYANGRFEALRPTLAGEHGGDGTLGDLFRRAAARGRLFGEDGRPVPPETVTAERARGVGVRGVLRLPDGRAVQVRERPTEDGGRVAVASDVTDRIAAEDLLKSRLAAMEASVDGIAVCDAGGRYTYVNPAHAAIYGFERPEDMVGLSWRDLYEPDEGRRIAREAVARVAESGALRFEATGRRRGGDGFSQEVTLTGLPDGGLVCVVRDVSERVRADEEHRRLSEQFFQAQKREAVGRLAGGIAHDFNNILAAILGYATMLAEDLEPGTEQRRFAQQIVVGGERAKELVRQILAFSRGGEADRAPVRAKEIADETTALLRATLPPQFALEVEDGAPGAAVLANAGQMAQVLMNLCVNARDAMMPAGGRLAVRIDAIVTDGGCADGLSRLSPAGSDLPVQRVTELPDGTVRLWLGVLRPPGRHLRVAVEDTGVGVPRDTAARMFEPFFTTKATGRGSGLGLAAVQQIVLGHGGALSLVSRPGGGTRVEVLLPLHAGAPAKPQAEPGTEAVQVRRTGRVLVIDDEEDVAAVTALALERLGFDAAYEVDPAAALEALESAPFDWDAVVTDQLMPGITGSALARRVLALRPDLPVIVCTGHADGLDEAGADAMGLTALLAKPVDVARLAEVLDAAVSHPAEAAA